MAGVYRFPDAKADYDRQLTENIERVLLLNMETILQREFNLDYPFECATYIGIAL